MRRRERAILFGAHAADVLSVATPAAVIIALWWRRTGIAIALISSLLLYASCPRFVSERLLVFVERQVPPRASDLANAETIAVLSGDIYRGMPAVFPTMSALSHSIAYGWRRGSIAPSLCPFS